MHERSSRVARRRHVLDVRRHVSSGIAFAFFLLGLGLFGCGGRTVLYAAEAGVGIDDASFERTGPDGSAVQDANGGPCETPDGVRVCGGDHQCPWLTPPTCSGRGCTPTGAGQTTGLCWTDLPDKGDRLCAACNDGEVCALRGSSQLVCVSTDVCTTLWEQGDTAGCRYADKSDYTNASLPAPTDACPAGLAGQYILCGGDCGACPSTPCVGRSPGRQFGICAWLQSASPQSVISTCSVPPGSLDCDQNFACAVFQVSANDEPLAKTYGLCIPASDCDKAAQVLPGGLHCY